MEIEILGGFNLLIGNHYFPPDMKFVFLQSYYSRLENVSDTQNFRVVFIGDVLLPVCRLLQNQGPSYMNFTSGVLLMLYESLPNCD
jgi:hypothetical protein